MVAIHSKKPMPSLTPVSSRESAVSAARPPPDPESGAEPGSGGRWKWRALGAAIGTLSLGSVGLALWATREGLATVGRGPTCPFNVPRANVSLPRGTFINPVLPKDCPDPGVYLANDGSLPAYMVCTGGSFPIRISHDLVNWQMSGRELLPGGTAAWSADGTRNWAAEMHDDGRGGVLAYYTAVNEDGQLAIGAARADDPLGDWQHRQAPLVSEPGLGLIDPNYFATGDRKYLLWKEDGNAIGKPSRIMIRPLADDGLNFRLGSEAKALITNDPHSWERDVVEAPWMFERDNVTYLLYSGNSYDERYATGVARSLDGPEGRFEKKGDPILGNSACWRGPGHGSLVSLGGQDHFFHHAWRVDADGRTDYASGRMVLSDHVTWKDGWPGFAGAKSSAEPQRVPA